MQQSSIQHAFFLLMLTAVTVAFFGVIAGFLEPIFWAAVFSVIFYPLQRLLADRLKGRESLAALLNLLIILLLVILPLIAIGTAVTHQARSLLRHVDEGEVNVFDLAESIRPMTTEILEEWGLDVSGLAEQLSAAAVAASQWFASKALDLGQDAIRVAALFALMLYILFFFLRDGSDILRGLLRALPLGNARERRLFSKFSEVIRATLKSTLVIAVVQGTLGGILFWLVGIRAPVLWGVVMAVLSLLPAFGAAIVWIPAAILLIVSGSWVRGLIVIGVGAGVISSVDNVLRPILVGRGTRMPDYLVLLSTLGGLATFGISGFVIGPVIASLFLAVWDMFAEEYAIERKGAPT